MILVMPAVIAIRRLAPLMLFTWGENFYGQLGDGTTTDRHIPTLIGTDTWIMVSAGETHSLGIRSDGRLLAWGDSRDGQLGDDTTLTRYIPTLIGTNTWATISAGGWHSLGINQT